MDAPMEEDHRAPYEYACRYVAVFLNLENSHLIV
jgi:hypothetical protein